MKKLDLNYSLKNIPVATKMEYQRTLTDKVEKLLGRVRWKLFWFRNPDLKKEKLNTFGFNSTKYPPASKELWAFEKDMVDLIGQIEMKPYTNTLQTKLKEDKKMIKSCKNIIIPADKTGNFYQVEPHEYKQAWVNTISKDYKKVDRSEVDKINKN